MIDVMAKSDVRTTSPHSPPARDDRRPPLLALPPPTLLPPLADVPWGGDAMLRTEEGVAGWEADPLGTGERMVLPLSLPPALSESKAPLATDGLDADFTETFCCCM